jgi:hypothetical protein
MSFAFAQLPLLLLLKLPKGLVQTRFAKLLDPRTHAELLNRVLTVFHGRFDLGSFFYFSLFSSSCPSWMLELFDVDVAAICVPRLGAAPSRSFFLRSSEFWSEPRHNGKTCQFQRKRLSPWCPFLLHLYVFVSWRTTD